MIVININIVISLVGVFTFTSFKLIISLALSALWCKLSRFNANKLISIFKIIMNLITNNMVKQIIFIAGVALVGSPKGSLQL